MRGKPILALIFVALMAIVLTIPLRATSDDGRGAKGRRVAKATPTPEEEETPTEEPTPTEAPSPTPTETETPEPTKPSDQFRFTDEYPGRCLAPAPSPEGDGRLAFAQGEGVAVTDLSGRGGRTVEGSAPFKWSPSGRYLLAGDTLYSANGEKVTAVLGDGSFSWGWSPVADCLLIASQDGGASVHIPGVDEQNIGAGVMERFAFSPDGTQLAYVDGGSRLWVAPLDGGSPRRLDAPDVSEGEDIVLAGWTPDESHVLFWTGEPDALLERGRVLLAAPADGGDATGLGRVLAYRDFLTSCGDDLYGILEGGSLTDPRERRLARIAVGAEPVYLTPENANDVSPSCAPEADLIAVARSETGEGQRRRELTVLDTSGGVSYTPQQGGFDDAYPMWGRTGQGLVFIRQPNDGGDAEVWRVSETIPAQASGVTVDAGVDPEGSRDSWGQVLDWSADEPSGLSVSSDD